MGTMTVLCELRSMILSNRIALPIMANLLEF